MTWGKKQAKVRQIDVGKPGGKTSKSTKWPIKNTTTSTITVQSQHK